MFTAGGGTVDLITYEVKKIAPYLELTELVPGTGGMVGSLVLNKLFEDTVRLVVGDEQFLNLKKSIGWAKAINEFDKNIKTAFDGDVTDVHYINFPKAELQDDPTEGLVRNCWEMTGCTPRFVAPVTFLPRRGRYSESRCVKSSPTYYTP